MYVMKKYLLLSLFVYLSFGGFSANFYWVGNGGNWSNFSSHWATTSNGTTMHTRVPNIGDTVYFDQYSFSATGARQAVVVDTTYIACSSMKWINTKNQPEFLSSSTDTLVIANQLILDSTSHMIFDFYGKIYFFQPIAGQFLQFNPVNQLIMADISINVSGSTLTVENNLIMSSKRLILFDGELDMSSHNLYVQHFNADLISSNPITVNSPSFSHADTVTCFGSLHFTNNLNISNFSGVIHLKASYSDSNYVNFGTHMLNSEFVFSSGKNYFLLSNLNTTQPINFPMNGQFFSQNYSIYCSSFKTIDPFIRTIDLGTSKIYTQEFLLEPLGLTLNSDFASLIFDGSGSFNFSTSKQDLTFKTVSVSQPNTIIWNGKIDVDTLFLIAGSKVLLKESSIITLQHLNANGSCGKYIELRAFCNDTILNNGECVSILPIFKSANSVSADYVKISNVKADGIFTLSNSYDEGGNEDWTVTQPNAISTLYWIGHSGNWNTLGNWSANSGGAPQNCIPTKATHVVFDNNSFVVLDTLKLNDYAYCASMTWRNLSHNVVFAGNGNLFVTDSIVLDNHLKADFSGAVFLENENVNDTISITTAGVEINAPITINGAALWNFVDSTKIKNELVFNRGKLKFSGNHIVVDNFVSNTSSIRRLDILNTTVELTGEGTVWDLNPANLTFISSGSNVLITGTSSSIKTFNGAGKTYNNIYCKSDFIKLNGGNTFKILKIAAGNTINFESNSICKIDSIDAISSCIQRISLISDLFDAPAKIVKTGYDTLLISDFFIKNMVADTVGSKYYEANQTISSGKVDGWKFGTATAGKTYKWLGTTKKWNTLSNWKVNNLPATCLPTINDTVVVDPVIFSTAVTDTILIDKNAFCSSFIADGIVNKYLHIEFDQNLYVAKSLLLSDSVGLNYLVKPSNTNACDYGVVIIPSSANGDLSLANANFNVNLYLTPSHLTDTVFLNSNLNMDTISGIFVKSGLFDVKNKTIHCGYFSSVSVSQKAINMSGAAINISMNLNFQDTSVLKLNADNSVISFLGNSEFFSYFEGGGQKYSELLFSGTTNDSIKDLLVFITGSNNYNVFKAFNGINLFVEAGKIQTVDSSLIIRGTCKKYLTLQSSIQGSSFKFACNILHPDTIICVKIKDCEINPTGIAILCENNGNNTGWTFSSIAAATSSFDLPYPACISTELAFINTSVSMWGGTNNLSYEWIITHQDTIYRDTLLYSFDYPGDYIVNLRTTDTITGCFDTHSDTLTINNHSVNLSLNIPGLTICQGSPITFTASSDLATEFEFYKNNIWIDLGDSTINQFTTNSIQDGDSVSVVAIYEGCRNASNSLKLVVMPSPSVSFTCSDIDTTICAGDSISFTAVGANFYQFFVDNIGTGLYNTNNVFTSTALNNAQVVTVKGKTAFGCEMQSPDSFTLVVNPTPTVFIASETIPPTICAGDTLSINSSGADLYEFFVGTISQGVASAFSNFKSTNLMDGNIVTAIGYNNYSCSSRSNSIDITVNPMPTTMLTSDQPDFKICTGENVVFTGSGAAEYQFFIDNIPQGAYSSTEILNTTSLTHNQTISLIGRIGNCYHTANDSIKIGVYPKIELISSAHEICTGQNIEFTASGDTIYQFFVDGVAVTPLGTSNVFASNTLTNGQQVSVRGTTNACLPTPISITTHAIPTIALSSSDLDNTICNGDSITFTASGTSKYEFFVNGISQGIPSITPQFSTNSLSSGQTVTVSGVSVFGCSNISSTSFTITVVDNPLVSLVSSETGNQICENATINFTASGADEYQFLKSGVVQGAFSVNPIFNASGIPNGSTFSVQGKRNGCVSMAPETYTYTVFHLPNVSLEPITSISVCQGTPVSVIASGAIEYEFFVNSISQGAPSPNAIFESTSLSNNDQITVVGSQNICSNISADVVSVNINQIPFVNFTSNIPLAGLCFGDTAAFLASGATSYQFYLDGIEYGNMTNSGSVSIPNLENNQTVNVVGYNNSCSSVIDHIIVINVNYVNLEIASNFDQNTLCSGEQVTVTATGSDIYQFFLNGISLGAPGANNTAMIPNITNGQYVTVEATASGTGCKTQSADYYFHVSEIPQITAGSDTRFCQNDSVILNTNSNYALQWYWNAGAIEGANQDVYTAHNGGNYSVFATSGSDSGVYSSGTNGFGQLGNGNNIQSLALNRALLSNPIKMITVGTDFEIALDESGNLFAWGGNSWGNLGIGTYSSVYTPVGITGISNVKAICAGYNHVLALLNDGTLKSWGRNSSGQLGYGNYASSNFPMQVNGIDSISAIAAGKSHSLALTTNGKVYSWGLNSLGQLGLGNLNNATQPMLISTLDSVVFIAAGADHSFAIRADGTLWAWGSNDNGQLGTNSINSQNTPIKVAGLKNISKVAAGEKHSVAVNQRGEIFTWGNNTDGQLGSGNASNSLIPTKINLIGVKEIACGPYNSFSIRNDGSLWSWGQNNFGQLGDQSTVNRTEPVKINQYFGIKQVCAGSEFMSAIWKSSHTCASSAINLTMDTIPNVTVTKVGLTLTCTAGQSYQWYFNGTIINNSNTQTINITAEGIYTARVFFENGCSGMSNQYSYYLSIADWLTEKNVQVVPNPNRGSFDLIIDMPSFILTEITSYSLINIFGAMVVNETNFKANVYQHLNFTDIAPGVYYLQLKSDRKNINIKVFITQ